MLNKSVDYGRANNVIELKVEFFSIKMNNYFTVSQDGCVINYLAL